MPPDPKARATTPRREPGTLALAGVVLVVALGAGYLGAQVALRPVRAALETRPPVVVLDLATVLKGVAAESAGAGHRRPTRTGHAPGRGRRAGARRPGGAGGPGGCVSETPGGDR